MSFTTTTAVPVSLKQTRQKIDANAIMSAHAVTMGAAITADRGHSLGHRKAHAALVRKMFADERSRFGLGNGAYSLTSVFNPLKGKDPSTNAKIGKNELATVSLTLQSSTVATVLDGFNVFELNTCTSSGLCAALCVLNHGKGSIPAVIRARNWRTWCLVRHPELFAVLLAYELDAASALHGEFLARLNVNSDILWHLVPELFDTNGMMAYDYTKHAEVLATTDGRVLPNYRLVYSINERSNDALVAEFLDRGGVAAMVTNRAKGATAHERMAYGGKQYSVEDGDISDNRYATPKRTIVDLYVKGKARGRKTRFVRDVY
jgi:hypothetical protein